MPYPWERTVRWKVLGFFLRNPEAEIHINELSRRAKISPRSAETYMKEYHSSDVLSKKAVANAHMYSLNNENPAVKQLKRLFVVSRILESRVFGKIRKKYSSSAIFGSAASGEYSGQSDLDLLLVGQGKTSLDEISKKTGMEVNVVYMGIGEWRKKVKSSDTFAENIKEKHILLHGADL